MPFREAVERIAAPASLPEYQALCVEQSRLDALPSPTRRERARLSEVNDHLLIWDWQQVNEREKEALATKSYEEFYHAYRGKPAGRGGPDPDRGGVLRPGHAPVLGVVAHLSRPPQQPAVEGRPRPGVVARREVMP